MVTCPGIYIKMMLITCDIYYMRVLLLHCESKRQQRFTLQEKLCGDSNLIANDKNDVVACYSICYNMRVDRWIVCHFLKILSTVLLANDVKLLTIFYGVLKTKNGPFL